MKVEVESDENHGLKRLRSTMSKCRRKGKGKGKTHKGTTKPRRQTDLLKVLSRLVLKREDTHTLQLLFLCGLDQEIWSIAPNHQIQKQLSADTDKPSVVIPMEGQTGIDQQILHRDAGTLASTDQLRTLGSSFSPG